MRLPAIHSRAALLACGLTALAACGAGRVGGVTDASAPRGLPAQGPVAVQWGDPAGFSEIRRSHNPAESRRGNWVEELARYLRERAQRRLPEGERLEVELRDIDRAGEFEPWRGVEFHDTRIIRDLYPPRIALAFRRLDAQGNVIAEGERDLTDGGFLLQSNINDSDPLRFEKRLIDRWLARELPPPQT